jgi:hypothetical protein
MAQLKGDVFARSLVFFEGRPCGGETDADIVNGAWNWAALDALYQSLEVVLRSHPRGNRRDNEAAVGAWSECEFRLWTIAEQLDPFLPRCLCPPGYRGFAVFDLRRRTYADVLNRGI